MIPIRLTIHNAWRDMPGTHVIDLNGVGDGIIAINGPNGVGKTHLLELLGPGTLFREYASYKEPFLAHVGRDVRDARVELVFEHGGSEYTARLYGDRLHDRGKGKVEAYLSGPGVNVGPKRNEYDEAVARLFPPFSFWKMTCFSQQGGAGNFFRLSRAERKDEFSRMIGVGHCQDVSLRAKALREKCEGEIDALKQKLADLKSLAQSVVEQEGVVYEAKKTLAEERREHEDATEELKRARDLHVSARKALDAYERKASLKKQLNDLFYLSKPGPTEAEIESLEYDRNECIANEARLALWINEARAWNDAFDKEISARKWKSRQAEDIRKSIESLGGVDLSNPMCVKCPLVGDVATDKDRLGGELSEEACAWEWLDEPNRAISRNRARWEARVRDESQERERIDREIKAMTIARRAALSDPDRMDVDTKRAALHLQIEQIGDVALDAPEAFKKIDDRVKGIEALLRFSAERLANAEKDLIQESTKLEMLKASYHEDELPRIESDLALLRDWYSTASIVEKAFGRDGIQALAIAGAGGEVSRIANDLLGSVFDGKYRLALETLRPKVNDDGMVEVFEARIVDATTGESVAQGSGGQMTVFDGALRASASIYNASMNPQWRIDTLFLDEPSGALDPEAAIGYVAMLRKMMQVGGFRKCFLISHQPAVVSQCDAVIEVEKGRIRL